MYKQTFVCHICCFKVHLTVRLCIYFRRQYNRSNADTNIGFNLQIAFNLTMTHMSCLLFQLTKIWKLDPSHATILVMLQTGHGFTFYTKRPLLLLICDTWLELWVQLEWMHGWCVSSMLYRIVDHYSHHRLHPSVVNSRRLTYLLFMPPIWNVFFHSGLSLYIATYWAYTQLSSMRFNGQCVAKCSNVWIEMQARLS